MTSTSLHELTATQLIELYKSGKATPVDATRDVIAQIARREPELQATYAYDPEGALKTAEESAARWKNGTPITKDGVTIDGIPTTIKENIATKGTPVPLAPPPRRWCPPNRTRRRRPACVKRGLSFWARPRCPNSARCLRACPASTR